MKLIEKILPLILTLGLIFSSFLSVEYCLPWLLIAFAVLGFREVSREKVWRHYTLSTFMLVYLIWLFVVSKFSEVPNTSLVMLAILSGMPVAYLVATNLKDYLKYWKILRTGFFLIGVVFALWGIWQVYTHVGRGHAIGPLVDRNAYSALINLLWFPSAYLFLTKELNNKIWVRASIGVGLFFISLALFATTSRGGIGIWLLLLPLFLYSGARYGQAKNLVLLVPLIACLAYISSIQILESNIADRTFEFSQDESTGARLMMWQSTAQMALAHPMMGTGWGTWSQYYPAYRLQEENISAGIYAHNDYLQFASEGGVLGFLILAGILISILILLKTSFKQGRDESGFESLALLLGTLAIFIHAAVNFIFYFAIINVITGIFLARVTLVSGEARIIKIPQFNQVRKPIKQLMLAFMLLLIATPYFLHQLSALSFFDEQPALKIINLVAPEITAQDVARAVEIVNPTNDLAKDALLQTSEFYLTNAAEFGIDTNSQRAILNEAIVRFDKLRAVTANQPKIGLREVGLLMAHQHLFSAGVAYTKARQVLAENLKADPRHVKSIIALSRLQLAEGHREQALALLQQAKNQVLGRRDQLLIRVELLRQNAAPTIIPELDVIEKDLQQLLDASERAEFIRLSEAYFDDIDAKLKAISSTNK